MLKDFLSLYFKEKIDKIITYGILVIIFFLWSISFDILKWYYYPFIIISISLILYLLLLRKLRRTCVILDTKLKREYFLNETGLESFKKKKLTKDYKSWLIKNAKCQKLKINSKLKIEDQASVFCFYLCYCTFPMVLILGTISIIYFSPLFQIIILILTIFFTLIIFFLLQKREKNKLYQLLDSEIKKIIFEEETGYKPAKRSKLTYKYKAWLVQNAEEEKNKFTN